MQKNLMTNSAVNAAAGMLMLFTGIISSIIAARLLGPEANGIIAFSAWLSLSGTMIAGLGTDVIMMRTLPQLKFAGIDALRRRGFASYLGWAVVCATAILLFFYIIFCLESEEHHWASTAPVVLEITGILFITQSIGMLSINYLISEQRPAGFLRLTLVSSTAQILIVLCGALIYGVAGALVGYIAGQVIFFVYSLRILFTHRDRCDQTPRDLIKISFVLSIQIIVESIFLNRIELLFIQQSHGVREVGFYAIGLSLANLALQLPVQLTGSLLPYYTEQIKSSGNGKLPIHMFEDVVRSLAYIALPMGFGVAAVSSGLLVAIFGEQFREAGNIVAILALGAPISVFMQISTKYLFAMDKEKPRMVIGGVGGAIMVAGCLLLVPSWGGAGAATVRFITFLVMSILMIRHMDFEGSLRPMFLSLAKITTAAALCGICAYETEQQVGGLLGLFFAIIVGVLVYALSVKVLKAMPRKDFEAIKSILGKVPKIIRGPTSFVLNAIVT